MKKAVERLMSGATRLLVLALGLGLVSTGWAGLVAEWNGDFDVTQKNGWTLTVGTGNTFANGVITIGASSTNPVLISNSNGGEAVTLVVGIKTSSSDTAGTVAHCAYETGGKGVYSYLNVSGESTSKVQYGWFDGSTWKDEWNAGGNVTWSSDSIQYVTLVALTDTDSPHNTNADPRGTTIYHNGTLVGSRQDGLRASNTAMTYLGVGGNVGRNSSGGMLNGAVISYIAIYDDALYGSTTPTAAQASVPTNLNLMYLISGDTIGASDGVALANDAGYGNVVPTVWQPGYRNYDGTTRKYGNSMRMNGGTIGLVDNTNGLGVNTTEGFTISFWADLVDGLAAWKSFLGIRVGESNLRLERQDSNNIAMYYFNATTAPSGGTKFSDMSYTASSWSHYALVFAPNNGDLTVYKDGTLVKTVTADADIQGTLYQVGMGMGRNGSAADSDLRGSAPANVYIDDLAIFKGALSESQISAIATSESAISGPVYGMYRTVSFATPQESVWATANLPNFAKTVTYGSGTVSFANDAYSKSTVNGKAARLTSIVGGSFTEIDGYVKYQQAADATSDVYLRVAGDTTATRVNGVGESDYSSGTRTFNGNILLNLTGSAVADHVMGAGYKGGTPTALTGDVGVVIDGNAVVKGTVLGGWSSVHNYKPKIDGSTYVLVKNVQGTGGATAEESIPNGYIMGGSSYQGNYGRSWITQNTSVAIDLPNDATGSFVKGIVGGSYGNHASQATEIGGSSSVTITAPNAVTFSGNIIGGCWANLGTASVGGNSSVTLNGGTYTGTIYAGGYGNGTPTVTGNATLTLNGGVYSGATLLAGIASGTKSLVISEDADLSNTTIAGSGFGVLSVDATKTLTLGTKRLVGGSDPTLASTSAGVVAFTLTAEEYAAGYANLMKCNVEDMTDKFVIYYNDEDITASVADKVSARVGHLVYMDATTYESTIAAETTSAWSDVVWTKADSSTATMEIASVDDEADATLTVNGTLTISSPVEFAGILTIEGSGTIVFTGNATLTAGKELIVSSGVALDFSGLTNLSNMGRDTIISAALGLEVNSSSTVFPSTWTCTSSTTATGFIISGYKNASDTVSINLVGGWSSSYLGGTIADDATAGFYPIVGAYWNQIASNHSSSFSDTVTVQELVAGGSELTDVGISVIASANNTYAAFNIARDGGNGDLLYGYLDDGGSGARITVNNIPYSEYAVLVYMGTDQTRTDRAFRPVTVNGTAYCGENGVTVAGSSNWGSFASTHGTVTLTEGNNFLRITGQTSSTLTIQGATASDNNRCGIAGIQIVNTGTRPSIYAGTINAGSATLAPSEGSTGIAKTSAGSWSNASTSRIVLTNSDQDEVSLTIGESITTKSFRIVGSGRVTLSLAAEKAITIADGSFDLSGFTGTLCVDSSMNSYVSLFGNVSTGTGGMVRFIGPITFNGSNYALPSGRVGFSTATLTGSLQSNSRTIVVEDGDAVTIQNAASSITALNFEVNGGSLTFAGTGKFWFGNNSTFTQTGGTVTFESTASTMVEDNSNCVIFGYSSSGTTVSISHGTFDMSGAALCLWQPSSTLTLSGDAVFKAKAIRAQSGNAGTAVTIGGSSKLILTGTDGIFDTVKSLTMNGGTIEFQESATIAKALTLTSGVESTINVADTKTATISTVALSAVPAAGDKILATNGGTITVSAITAGGVAQELDLSYWSDGVYVAAAEYDSVNYPSVSAAIAVAGDANLADITLLNGCTTVPAGYYINDDAVVKCPAAIVYAAGDPDYYNNVQAAVNAANGKTYAGDPYEYVAVYANAAVTTAMTLKIKPMNEAVVTVSVPGITSEYALNDETDENGVVTYTIDPASTDYTWVAASGVWDTTAVAPWRYDDSGTPTQANRAPTSIDAVVFASDAAVTVDENISVSSISVSSVITLTKSSSDVTVTATTGGIVLTDIGASITVSGVTLSPTPTTTVANSYVKLDGSTYSVDAYNTVTFDAPHATVNRTDGLGNAIKDGDTITFTVAADQGYSVTGVSASSGSVSGAGPYSYVVAGNATITVTTQQDAQITGVVFDYYVGYTNADVRVTVDQAGTYTLTVGGTEYAQPALEAGEITFENVNVTGVSTSSGVAYTITASGGASGTTGGTSPAQSSGTVTDTGWMAWSENGDKVGTWSADEPSYTAGVAAFTGTNTYTAAWMSTGEVVTVTTNVKFGDVADPDITPDTDAQAAVRIGTVNDALTFQVLTNNNEWAAVSSAGLTPSGETEYTVEVKLNYSTQTYGVKIGDNQLALTGSNPAVTLFPLAKAASAMQQVSYLGAGSFISLSGEYVSAGYTADVGTEGSATNVVVSSDFVNTYLGDVLAKDVKKALAPNAARDCANGLNYFESYALGLDPTAAEEKPVVSVTTDEDGKFKVTLKKANGLEIVPADNVALKVTLKAGSTPDDVTGGGAAGEITAERTDQAATFTIDPTKMSGTVQYYKVQIDIGAM